MSGLVLPALAVRLRDVYGPDVDAWLDEVPATVAELSNDWGLTDVGPIASDYIGVSVVLQGRSALHGDVVLKLVPPDGEARVYEASALAAWNGRGAVRLLERDAHRRALLLERLAPGEVLDATDETDDDATRALAEVAARLAVAPPGEVTGELPGLDDWAEDLGAYVQTYGSSGPVDADLVQTARRLIDRLLETAPPGVLLHGDLHHDNVLRSGRTWVAIDPKGYVGDPASEPGQMFFNPTPYVRPRPDAALQSLVERRLAAWARFSSLDPTRVHQWAFVKAVVSDVWSVEEGGEPDGLPTRVARALLTADPALGASPQ